MKKEKRSSLTLRLPSALHEWVARKAKENFTSLNDEVIRALNERQQKEKDGATA